MTKTRTINEMLQAIYDYITDTMYSDNTMLHSGLCIFARNLFGRYTYDCIKLMAYFGDNLPPYKPYIYSKHMVKSVSVINYCWKPYQPYYRLKWLKKHIELTKTHSQ